MARAHVRVQRFTENPIIYPNMDNRMGANINGPSLIRVPEWVEDPLGRYYLYFAHHEGTYIRPAYADRLEGPWRIHTPGVLNSSDAFYDRHIASPDVHVINGRQEIRMHCHGCCRPEIPHQTTRAALSRDGIHFDAQPEILGASYWRVFRWRGYFYTLEMPGTFRRSKTGLSGFEQGPTLFSQEMRHAAVKLDNGTLHVFYSNAHDAPEQILHATIDPTSDWSDWKETAPETLLNPEHDYEGGLSPGTLPTGTCLRSGPSASGLLYF